jgi:ferric-dicitrate binding protein FerR (iron transport regulator)
MTVIVSTDAADAIRAAMQEGGREAATRETIARFPTLEPDDAHCLARVIAAWQSLTMTLSPSPRARPARTPRGPGCERSPGPRFGQS